MAVTNGYATRDELAAYLASQANEAAVDYTNRATALDDAVNAASRAIDTYTGRRFHKDGSATARVYVPDSPTRCVVDDFHTTTGLVVKTDTGSDGTYDLTWTSGDYQLEPLNGVYNGRSGFPWWVVRAVDVRCFPMPKRGRATVEVTADWGWDAVPDDVHQACLILAHKLLRRPAAPEGVVGFADFGVVRRITGADRDVVDLLAPFMRPEGIL